VSPGASFSDFFRWISTIARYFDPIGEERPIFVSFDSALFLIFEDRLSLPVLTDADGRRAKAGTSAATVDRHGGIADWLILLNDSAGARLRSSSRKIGEKLFHAGVRDCFSETWGNGRHGRQTRARGSKRFCRKRLLTSISELKGRFVEPSRGSKCNFLSVDPSFFDSGISK
jgi:hypothetical protein